MTNHNYGEGFYKSQYELLVKAMRERDLKIVELQEECSAMQERLNDLTIFQNFVFVSQQFFQLMTKPQKKIK